MTMNDLIDWTLDWLAPHICKGCGVIGRSLCECCIFNILRVKYRKCVFCGATTSDKRLVQHGNICANCARTAPFIRAFVAGERRGVLQKLVDEFKFHSERGSAGVMACLLDGILPDSLPSDMVIVPLTTVSRNVRIRGFDHMKIVAQKLARMRGLIVAPHVILRTNNLTQHFMETVDARRRNAEKSFATNPRAKVPERILLIDDIITTGSSVKATAEALRQAGAKEVWLAVVARQA